MKTARNFKVAYLPVGFLGAFCTFSEPAHAQQEANQSFYAVNTIAKRNDSTDTGISLVDFESRWSADNDDLVVDNDGVIRPYRLPPIDETVTGSIPAHGVDSAPLPKTSKSESIVKGVSGSSKFSPECGPSPLSEAQIRNLVITEAEAAKVDSDFALAITSVESKFDRIRNSPKGARGPMQLMPDTAGDYGVQDICDPEDNIRGGVAHLRHLFDTLTNPLLVAAAYNAGEGRIGEYGGIPPFEETLNYVAKVINFELGLDPPNARQSARTSDRQTASRDNPSPLKQPSGTLPSSGVTRSAKGKWVAGVLQF